MLLQTNFAEKFIQKQIVFFTPLTIFVALHWAHSSKSIFFYKAPHARCGLSSVERGELSTPSSCWQLCS